MNTEHLLIKLVLGGLLGFVGQGIRVVVGLKKLKDEATAQATQKVGLSAKTVFNDQFDARQIWLSLLIGFIAGCLASIVRDDESGFSPEAQLAIVAAGYAGTDFIEGLLKKALPTN